MKQRSFILCLFLLLMLFTAMISAHADTGPKPSVTVTLENLPEGRVYATLLSKTESTGPYFAGRTYDQMNEYGGAEVPRDIWDAFSAYTDPDGFYFLGYIRDVTKTKTFSWTYYPPQDFKLLIYLADSGTFLCSEADSRYAFDSAYTADCALQPISLTHTIVTLGHAAGFLLRLLITLAVELFIALLFDLREKRQILVIVLTNLVTQILLNLVLMSGPSVSRLTWWSSWTFLFILCEIAVIAVEAIVYAKTLEDENHSKKQLAVYALIANLASLVIGCFLLK